MADKRTWLDGPGIPGQYDDPDAPGKWPGEKLGLPKSGSGSLVSVGKRALAVFIDWMMCLVAGNVIHSFVMPVIGGPGMAALILWLLLGIIGGWLFARTPGMAILGMGVARVDAPGHPVGLWRAVVRTLLTGFFFPAALVDTDGRGLHDRGTGTAVIYQ